MYIYITEVTEVTSNNIKIEVATEGGWIDKLLFVASEKCKRVKGLF